MRFLRPLPSFFAAALLLLSSPALAADWYVDASAPSGGTGSQSSPFSTINAALPGLSRGDTVWLASGTYDETVNIPSLPGSGTTTFRASPGATPIIDGTSGSSAAGFVVQTAVADTTFQGLTIQNAVGGALGIQFYYADGGSVIDCTTKNMSANAVTFYYSSQGTVTGGTFQGNIAGRKTTGTVVEGNEVYGSSAEGIGLYDGSTGCTVSHNVIHDNFSVNLYLDSISHSVFDGNLIYESASGNDLEGIEISDEGHYSDLPAPVNSYNTIINNVVYGHAEGIVFWLSDEWSTTALNNESGLRYDIISNNTVINNGVSLKWDASPAHIGTTIENNIFASAAGTSPTLLLQANSMGGISLDHNLWFAPDLSQPFLWVGNQSDHPGYVTASGGGGGDVLDNPMLAGAWMAPPAQNLALAMGSPAIGAGVTLAAVTTDFLGALRPSSGTDLGAFQLGAKVPADGGAAPPVVDAGAHGTHDAGVTAGKDAGSSRTSSGDAAVARDGGETPASKTSSGCSCRITGAGGESTTPPVLLMGLALLAVRRKRAR